MAIPVYLQQFKAAGVYRVVFDKTTVAGVDSEVLRLVVGYSEKGPFNIPTYVTSVSNFKAIYGDISKKLEKRGVFFHRMALQALATGPILCLNLKKFDGETVDASTISTAFNPTFDVIDTVKLNVEDIYDTGRFWEISAEKLINLRAVNGTVLDQYINISTTNTKDTSATYFIRKASGLKVNNYKLTVSDWYSDKIEEIPDYLRSYTKSMVSDFFAEVYVFNGQFSPSQVLSSSTLKNYFEMIEDEKTGDKKLVLRDHVTNAYGEWTDTLDALYSDETSGALGHYVGALIPNFKNKSGQYVSLDILFNSDNATHNMMMSFNTDLLDEGIANIDISGRLSVSTDSDPESKKLTLDKLFEGTAKTTLLGNVNAPVVTDVMSFTNNVVKRDEHDVLKAKIDFNANSYKASGTLYVHEVKEGGVSDNDETNYIITLKQVGTEDTIDINVTGEKNKWNTLVKLGCAEEVKSTTEGAAAVAITESLTKYFKMYASGFGTYYTGEAFINNGEYIFEGPQNIITSITRIEPTSADYVYTDDDMNMKVTFETVSFETVSNNPEESVYGTSITFIPVKFNTTSGWKEGEYEGVDAFINQVNVSDNSIFSIINVGDCFLADDASTDRDADGELDAEDGFYDNVYVQDIISEIDPLNGTCNYVVKFSGAPMTYNGEYLVRVDNSLNQEMGIMEPHYLEGYVYKNDRPAGTSQAAKLEWQHFILSTLTEYKGLRTGLLNKSDIDYRYIVDTFESFVESDCKNVLSMLAKEKQSAFAILNFPAVKTFVKCPYVSFTDNKGVFNVEYVVAGYNKRKAASTKFSLPTEQDGASFCAFYTPVKLTDGYVDTIVPSACLVSNLFIQKYSSRQPYYIIAGPNYGRINVAGLVGPDYTYSPDELQIIEPFGVNCLVYRPGFGTFINANQTAKQTPVSALSKVNVRELVIYIQDEIEKVLQSYQWEFNNPSTRAAILNKANSICANVLANGGIQAYLNVMDESNNTPEIIDNEMAVISTHIEPGMGCGKMVQQLTLYKTGMMSSMISD